MPSMSAIPSLRRPSALLTLACLLAWALVGCNGADGNAVGSASAAKNNAIGVLTELAREEEFTHELEALGTARANEAVEITSKVSNRVVAIHFREGQEVRRGAVLVELDAVEAGAEVEAARAALSETQSQYKRSTELFATQALSQSQLDQLQATLSANRARVTTAESRLSDTIIRAPFDGRTGLRRVSVGSLVSPGSLITTLDDTRTIKLDFSVPETFIAVLREGLPVTARSVAFPGREFSGTVSSIDSRLDPVTRSVTVRAAVPNPDGALKPGMFLTVRLRQAAANVVMISEQALVPEEGRQFVFVVESERAQKREITIGRRKPGRVEVISGLKPGERVIVEGTQKVRDGAPVQEAEAPPEAPAS